VRRVAGGGRKTQEGVAYLMALFLLFVFTMLALALNLAMQSELFSASHPPIVARLHYAAESGLAVAVARALASGEIGSTVLRRQHREVEEGGLVEVEERLEVVVGARLAVSPCDYCSVEVRDSWSEQEWSVLVRAERGPRGRSGAERGRSFAAFSAEAEFRVSPLAFRSECVAASGGGAASSTPNTLVARLRVVSSVYPDLETHCMAVTVSAAAEPPALVISDLETSVPVVKIQLDGAALGAPAAADRDLDGVVDYIYVGTAAGSLYRIDVGTPLVVSESAARSEGGWTAESILRIPGRTLMMHPSIFFVGGKDAVGLVAVFGLRDESVAGTSPADRQLLVVLLDDEPSPARVAREEDYRALAWGDRVGHPNLLLDDTGERRPGWILRLEPYERVTRPAFVFSGLLAFDAHRVANSGSTGDCKGSSPSRLYRLQLTNGDPADGEGRSRSMEGCAVRSFALPPWEEDAEVMDGFSRGEFRGELSRIEEGWRARSVDSCRFGAFYVHAVSQRTSGTHFPLARVPVCVTVSNWIDL